MGTSIAASVKAKKAEDAARKKEAEDKQLLEDKKAKDEALFDLQYYQDFTDRTEVQDMLRVMNENDERKRNQDLATAATTGMTEQQQLAAAEQRGKARSDAMAGMARNASMMKDGYLQNYQQQLGSYTSGMLGVGGADERIYQNEAAQLSGAGNNLFSTGANVLSKLETKA